MGDTHVAELSYNLPHPAFIESLHHSAILLQEESKRTKTQLCLDEQLSILLPGIDKSNNVGARRFGEMSQNVNLLKMTQTLRQPNPNRRKWVAAYRSLTPSNTPRARFTA